MGHIGTTRAPLGSGGTRARGRDTSAPLRPGLASAVSLVTQRPGTPLSPAVQAEVQSRFGFDFGSIRVHADEEAAQSASALGARPTHSAATSSSAATTIVPSHRAARRSWHTS
jgi:acyl dehydratase